MERITSEQVQRIILNPFYAIQVAPELVETHAPSLRDEEWITGNSSLLQQMGAEHWQALLLDVLQGNTPHDLVNPYHAINIDPLFAVEHPPAFSKEQWIQANMRSLSELGTESWLHLLLEVLEGDFVTSEDIKLVAPASEAGHIRFHAGKQKRRKHKKHKR